MDLDELAKHLSTKGTCMTVEKSYFRLTQAPDPSEVRPEPVLMETLKMLESKWNGKKADYKYIDDQFRSLRQDLTVQRIQNDFCVKVSRQLYSLTVDSVRFMKPMRGQLLKKLTLINSTNARPSLDIFTVLVIKEIDL